MAIESGITPEIRSLIESTILKYESELTGRSAVAFYTFFDLIVQLSRSYGVNPLQEMQRVCDERQIDIKNVAVPKQSTLLRLGLVTNKAGQGLMLVDPDNYLFLSPHAPNVELPYRAHTLVKRMGEYYELLTLLELSEQENFMRLAETGLLVPRPSDQTLRIVESPNN